MTKERLLDLLDDTSTRIGPSFSARQSAYLSLDTALCRAIFGEAQPNSPVYLDMDEDVLERAGSFVGMTHAEFSTALAASVRQLIEVDDTTQGMFSLFENMVSLWPKVSRSLYLTNGQYAPPPVIGLLSVFVLAAEQMGVSDQSGSHENAYYPRLLTLLGFEINLQNRLKTNFRRVSEQYWDLLALWLDDHEGQYGVPSAFALTFRHVGLALSQALIRAKERQQLKRAFLEIGFRPGQVLALEEMRSNLGAWIEQQPSPVSVAFQNLWSRSGAQDRICDIAINELQSWDGTAVAPANNPFQVTRYDRCDLFIQESADLFGNDIEIGFAVSNEFAPEGTVGVSHAGGVAQVSLWPLSVGLSGVTLSTAGIDAASFMAGVLDLVGDEARQRRYVARPIIPMHFDNIAGVWLETDQVVLAEPCRLLARVENLPLLQRAFNELGINSAAPAIGAEIGIPDGWAMLSDFQIMSDINPETFKPEELKKIACIRPRLSTKISLSDGFKLPGHGMRWSPRHLPTVSVASNLSTELTLQVRRRDLSAHVGGGHTIFAGEAPFVVGLDGHISEPGNYQLELIAGTSVVQRQSLRIESSSQVNSDWDWKEEFGYSSGRPGWPFYAAPNVSLEAEVRIFGAMTQRATEATFEPAQQTAPTDPWWAGSGKRIQLPAAEAGSCGETGAHNFDLGKTGSNLHAGPAFYYATCRRCGFRMLQTSRAKIADKERWARLKAGRVTSTEAPRRARPTIALGRSEVASETQLLAAIDAVVGSKGGSGALLDNIARRVQPNALFAHEFVRTVEALALIDVERDSRYQLLQWEATAQFLVEVVDGGWFLSGYWQEEQRNLLLKTCRALGGREYWDQSDGTILPILFDVDVDELRTASGIEFVTLDRPAEKLAAAVPAYSEAIKLLPRTDMLGWTNIEWFDVDTVRWRPSATDQLAGAYRIKNRFAQTYVFRSATDISEGTAVVADAAVVKHAAAQVRGRPLIAYSPEHRLLMTPLGCELPGLYARAATLCSGKTHMRDHRTFSLQYRDVPTAIAEALYEKLAS